MPHPVGERFRCDECGAEIVFVKACPCPETESEAHADICCGKQMQRLESEASTGPAQPEAVH
jgi:hypothetical protein